MTRHARTAWTAVALLAAVPAGRCADAPIDSAMDRDPELPTPRVVTVFPDRTQSLWLEALGRPEAEFRCQAALAIGTAHRQGMVGLSAAIPALLAALDQPDRPAAVGLAAARALVELDARDSAPALLRHARSGDPGLRDLVEPALARWDYPPARAVWLDRLGRPGADRGGLIVAVRCLAAVREDQAAPGLHSLVVGRDTPAPVRLAAARALGELRRAGSEGDARRLAAAPDLASRLSAAALLRHHAGGEAVGVLQDLGRDAEPAVAAGALGRVIEIDPKLVAPECGRLLASPDVRLRLVGVEVLSRTPSDDPIRLLGARLDDPHPDVRVLARQGLLSAAANPMLRAAVAVQGVRALTAPDWRGQEQAAVLVGQLRHEPAAARLIELLTSARPEVFVAAAWGLRQLRVPETLPAVATFLESPWWDGPASPGGGSKVSPEAIDQQLSQLAQLLGQAKYASADKTLRRFVPRRLVTTAHAPPLTCPETRAAAIWALGQIHAGKPPPGLVRSIEDRLTDENPVRGDEHPRVRRMAAVTLGRLKAEAALASLRTYQTEKPAQDPLRHACAWAVGQITGAAPPSAGTVGVPAREWFLVPVEPGGP